MPLEISIPKLNDAKILSEIGKVQLGQSGPTKIDLQAVNDANISGTPDEFVKDALVSSLKKINGELIRTINLSFPQNGLTVAFRRTEEVLDKITVRASRDGQPMPAGSLELISDIRKHFGAVSTPEMYAKYFGTNAKEYLGARETELRKLEEIGNESIRRAEEFRQRIETEFEEKKNSLEATFQKKEIRLAEEHEKKLKTVEERNAELDARAKQLDDRNNRHARRSIRQELKKEIEQRKGAFQLSKETTTKHRILFITTLVIVAFLGVLSYQATKSFFALLEKTPPADSGVLIGAIVRQVLYGAAFLGMSIYLVRWYNHWLQKHANEEFQLRQFDLDVDRASWIVEMTMEWKESKDSPLPPHLLEQLTKNLFETRPDDGGPRHPAEQLGTQLLSMATTLKLKGQGAELEFDKRGLSRLNKGVETGND